MVDELAALESYQQSLRTLQQNPLLGSESRPSGSSEFNISGDSDSDGGTVGDFTEINEVLFGMDTCLRELGILLKDNPYEYADVFSSKYEERKPYESLLAPKMFGTHQFPEIRLMTEEIGEVYMRHDNHTGNLRILTPDPHYNGAIVQEFRKEVPSAYSASLIILTVLMRSGQQIQLHGYVIEETLVR